MGLLFASGIILLLFNGIGKFGSFYYEDVRGVMGVGCINNEILYILSDRFVLHLYMVKLLLCFGKFLALSGWLHWWLIELEG